MVKFLQVYNRQLLMNNLQSQIKKNITCSKILAGLLLTKDMNG